MSSRTRRAQLLGVAGAVLLVAGTLAIVVATRAQRSAPQPPAGAASPVNVTASSIPSASTGASVAPHRSSASATTEPTTSGPVLARSVPVRLQVPAIHVDSTLEQIGLNSRGEISTPPLVKDSHAYWLNVSPTPGQLGPATVIGHVDSAAYGPGVFFELGALRQRDRISITRSDGIVATFEVQRVVEYKKNAFPTQQVYGNLDYAGLRLITCGGTFDRAIGSYESNIVVYAALVSYQLG
ncbi:MAG TPA: class F sortase [Jatrophihabitans sp.]|nr:class F sortase [Jatrophihabitans sp.]